MKLDGVIERTEMILGKGKVEVLETPLKAIAKEDVSRVTGAIEGKQKIEIVAEFEILSEKQYIVVNEKGNYAAVSHWMVELI